MVKIKKLHKINSPTIDRDQNLKSFCASQNIRNRLKNISSRIDRIERIYGQNRRLSKDSKKQNLAYDVGKLTENNITKERKKENLIDHIKDQTENLEHQLLSAHSVIVECALTEFLMSVIDEINRIISFRYRLTIEDK